MTRRLQLLDPKSRSSGRRVTVVFGRIRDSLLRDNKVVPAVLGILALLIFAWLIAGYLIGGIGGEEEQQASNQASLAQGEDSDSGDSETPAPGADNRDSDASYGGYDEGPKDPFRNIINKADEGAGGGQNGSQSSSQSSSQGSSRGGNQNDKNGGDRNVGSANRGTGDNGQGSNRGRTGVDRGGGGDSEGFIGQSSPGDPGFQGAPGGGDAGQGGAGQGGAGQGGADQAGAGQGGGLFNSGGDLPMP
jgi:hypothetical protein